MGRPATLSYTTPKRDSVHSVPFYVGILVISLLSGLMAITYLFDTVLPTPLFVEDEIDNPNAFISERASWDVHNLTAYGPRVVGSDENEVLAVDYLLRRIHSIIQHANVNQFIEKDVQIVSGAYFLTPSFLNSYDNVQNIVVKLYGYEGAASLLLNAHFDSVPTSPGASDDSINVAVLLEILRIYSQSDERPRHNIIFLFNGAEETPLQASHGFITQHKWAHECRAVVNLDACGSGGKIILFQTGPQSPWLVKYYSGVPHPFGQVAGEELFQTGLLPSDTDYRIFRDYGKLVGLDMAFIKNGYRYHTKFDHVSYIPLGSYQHVGDNTLYLVKMLSNATELLQNGVTEGSAIYYDIFGLFFISYSNLIGCIINIITIILSLIVFLYSMFKFHLGFSKPTLKFLSISSLAVFGSWIVTILFVIGFSLIIDLLGHTMSWFRQVWLIYGLYAVPCIGFSGYFLFLTNHETIASNIRTQLQAHLIRLIFTLILGLGVIFNIRASYAFMIPVLFSSLAFITIHICGVQHSVRKWQIIYIAFLIIPTMLLMYQQGVTLTLLIPMMSFIGSSKNPDIIIGILTVFFAIIITSPWTALTTLLRNAKLYFLFLGIIFTASFVILFTPLGFPYSGDVTYPTPQRQWIFHTSRNFYNESGQVNKTDAGFLFLNLDRNSPRILRNYVKDLDKAVQLRQDCERYLSCGVPLLNYRMINYAEYTTWIPTGPPALPNQITWNVTSEILSNETITYNVSISGPHRISVSLMPRLNINIIYNSLANITHSSTIHYNNRPVYFISYQLGKGVTNFTFQFTVSTSPNWTGPTVDVSVVGTYVQPTKKTLQFEELLNQMPNWAAVTAWLASAHFYSI